MGPKEGNVLFNDALNTMGPNLSDVVTKKLIIKPVGNGFSSRYLLQIKTSLKV